MTDSPIVATLSKEFSISADSVAYLVDALSKGLLPPYLGRFAREHTGLAQEGLVRRFAHRLEQLEELERRRATILRTLEGLSGVSEKTLTAARTSVDRNVLEDLYLPYRQPEPEVQLALDRGLGSLADALARSTGPAPAGDAEDESSDEPADGDEGTGSDEAAAPAEHDGTTDAPTTGDADAHADAAATTEAESSDAESSEAESSEAESSEAESSDAATPEGESTEAADADGVVFEAPKEEPRSETPEPTLAFTAELARTCAPFVQPDRDVHTDRDALEGAMRILSDRLGRDPVLRAQLRKLMLRHAVVKVRAGASEDRLKRHRALLKLAVPVRQLQGSRLLSLRQAQRERAVHVVFEIAPETVLPKVRSVLCRRPDPAHAGVIDLIAWQAWTRRLRPMLEEDLRLELKGRADEEATRLVVGQVRQLLMAPTLGPRPAAGLDVDARGDFTLVAVDQFGNPMGAEVKIAVAGKDDFALAEEIGAALRDTDVRWIALAASRAAKPALARVRAAVASIGGEAVVTVVNEAGLSAWANSEPARKELEAFTVQGRMAISLARRLQDPMSELLKVDSRHWGIGLGTGMLTKAAAKRIVSESIQSCACSAGVAMDRPHTSILEHLPGIDAEKAAKLLALVADGSLRTREDLRSCGLFDETQWRNVAAFLRFWHSDEPFDKSSMHPEQYELARRIVEATGRPFEEVYGRAGGIKGQKRVDFGVDEATWRDIVRELGHPGRDPRPRLFPPRMLPAGTTSDQLAKDQVVEGIVTTVTNFGAFVDIGTDKEGLVHVSRVSDRFVRDAREVLSVGQVVRALVVDTQTPRITLTMKGVPDPERAERPRGGDRGPGRGRGPRGRGDGQRGEGRRGDGQRGEAFPEPQRLTRVARARRDGMPGQDADGRGGRGKGRGQGGGGGRGPGQGRGGPGGGGGRGRGRDQGGRDQRDDAAAAAFTRPGKEKSGYNPFASFFSTKDDEGATAETE